MKTNNEIVYALAYIINHKYNAKIADIGEIENNFYIDFDSKKKISINDLKSLQIETLKFLSCKKNKMSLQKIKKSKLLKCKNVNNNLYHKYWVSSCKNNDFEVVKINDDFCYINRLNKSFKLNVLKNNKIFKLTNVSGIYWLGNEKNKQLQRIIGYAFSTIDDEKKYLNELKDRSERDHRKLGAQLELFTFDELAGQGHPIWLPNGTTIIDIIDNTVKKVLLKYGFNFVSTPILGSIDLYKTSGHWFHYRENMYNPVKIDNEQLILRPMTCPHHLLVYKSKQHSYRELPFALAEKAILHRYESSGALIGLERVRCMQLIDTHTIIRPDQIQWSIEHYYKVIIECLKLFNIKIYRIDLSLHDTKNKNKYFNNPKMWTKAEHALESCLRKMKLKYVKKIGEAAFYGPKIDIQMQTALGHIITMSTIQLDFLLPDRFKLEYVDNNGKKQRPILVHGGIIGTLERFMSILLESTKGVFPLWLAPIQFQLIPIHTKYIKYCQKIKQKILDINGRVVIDDSDEHLNKKIRNAQVKKIPYHLIIGEKEAKSNSISYREYGKQETKFMKFEKFINQVKNKIVSH